MKKNGLVGKAFILGGFLASALSVSPAADLEEERMTLGRELVDDLKASFVRLGAEGPNGLEAARDYLVEAPNPLIGVMLDALAARLDELRHGPTERARPAIESFAAIGASRFLVEGLGNPSMDVNILTVKALKRVNDPAVVDELGAFLLREMHENRFGGSESATVHAIVKTATVDAIASLAGVQAPSDVATARTEAILDTLRVVSGSRQVVLFSQEEEVRRWAEKNLEPDQLVHLDSS